MVRTKLLFDYSTNGPTNRSICFRCFRIYSFFQRSHGNFFIWTGNTMTCIICPRIFDNALICSSESGPFFIYSRSCRPMPVFYRKIWKLVMYKKQARNSECFTRSFGNFTIYHSESRVSFICPIGFE